MFDPMLEHFLAKRLGQDLMIVGFHFWIPFLEVLELFGGLLGAYLGLPRLSWKALDTKNIDKLIVFLVFR